MRTIQEKYNAILEGNFSKTQFLRDAKRELSQFLSPYNGYPDTVQILKNKGMLVENFDKYSNDALTDMIVNLSRYQDNEKDIEGIKRELEKRKKEVVSEAKKEKATNYEPTPAGLPAEAVSRGIDYELEAIGVNTGVEMPTEEQLAKVTAKVNKNLAKNMNYYLDLIAGESKKVDKHDKLVAATKKNTVDTFNGMKKASLKESVLEKAMSKGYTKEQVEAAIKNLKEKKGKDHDGDGDIDGDDYMMAKDKAIKGAKNEGASKEEQLKIAHAAADKAEMNGDIRTYELALAAIDLINSDTRTMDEVELANTTLTKANQAIKSPATLAQTFLNLYKQIQDKEQSDFSKHPKFGKVLGILQSMTKDQEQEGINEGRRKKSKGGKIVTENDYETGGYIESMGPLFDRACDMLAKAFGEWVNGPMTEPGMIAPAKKDVVNYLDQKLTSQFLEESNSVEESIDREFHSTSDTNGHPNPYKMSVPEIEAYIKDNPTTLWGRSLSIWKMVLNKKKGADTVRDEQLKEAMKGIIANILTEEVITEAATGNLSKIADTYNDYEGMQTAVNALENIVTDVESYNSKTRDKIQKIYDSFKDIKNVDGLVVGSFLAPAIEAAFRKDLSPVSQKGFTANLALPKTNVIKSGEVQEEELDEKETVFTPMSEVTAAQQKYVDKAASKPSKPVKTQLRKDTQAAKRAIDSGKLTDQQIIKKYGIEAFNAVNAENEFNEGVNESKKTKYTKR